MFDTCYLIFISCLFHVFIQLFQIKGEQAANQSQIQQWTKHLESEMFCNADDKYLHKIYELKVHLRVCSILNFNIKWYSQYSCHLLWDS